MTAIVRNAKKLEAGGVKIFTKNAKDREEASSQLRRCVIQSIGQSRLMKDPTKLPPGARLGGGRARAARPPEQLARLPGLIENTNTASIGRTSTSTSPRRRPADAAMNNLKLSVAEAFTPARIQAFAQAVGAGRGPDGQAGRRARQRRRRSSSR